MAVVFPVCIVISGFGIFPAGLPVSASSGACVALLGAPAALPDRLVATLAILSVLGLGRCHEPGRFSCQIDPFRPFRVGRQIFRAIAVGPKRRRNSSVRDVRLRLQIISDPKLKWPN
jgi:hypothetical protein